MNLDITTYPPVNGNHYLALAGRLDSTSYALLDTHLEPLLAEHPQALVLDLAHLEYISSAGVRSLLRARKTLAPQGGRVLIVHPQEQIRKVLEIVQAVPMESIFARSEDADAYLDELQRRILEGDSPQK